MKPPKMRKLATKAQDSTPKLYMSDDRPYITLDSKQLPELKEWEVGEKYTLMIEVEQTSMRKNSEGLVSAEFKISKVGAMSEDEAEEEEEEMESEDNEKEESDEKEVEEADDKEEDGMKKGGKVKAKKKKVVKAKISAKGAAYDALSGSPIMGK